MRVHHCADRWPSNLALAFDGPWAFDGLSEPVFGNDYFASSLPEDGVFQASLDAIDLILNLWERGPDYQRGILESFDLTAIRSDRFEGESNVASPNANQASRSVASSCLGGEAVDVFRNETAEDQASGSETNGLQGAQHRTERDLPLRSADFRPADPHETLSLCEKECLEFITNNQNRITSTKLFGNVGSSYKHPVPTMKTALARLVTIGLLKNCSHCKPRGYGLPDWPHTCKDGKDAKTKNQTENDTNTDTDKTSSSGSNHQGDCAMMGNLG